MPQTESKHIPRPENSFMLYRKHNWERVKNMLPPKAPAKDVVRRIAVEWKRASLETKMHYNHLADQEKRRHALMYPGYKYQPKRKNRSVRGVTVDNGGWEEISTPTTTVTVPGAPENGSPSFSEPHQNTLPLAMQNLPAYPVQSLPVFADGAQQLAHGTYPHAGLNATGVYGQHWVLNDMPRGQPYFFPQDMFQGHPFIPNGVNQYHDPSYPYNFQAYGPGNQYQGHFM